MKKTKGKMKITIIKIHQLQLLKQEFLLEIGKTPKTSHFTPKLKRISPRSEQKTDLKKDQIVSSKILIFEVGNN
jgi:hypothetical protein